MFRLLEIESFLKNKKFLVHSHLNFPDKKIQNLCHSSLVQKEEKTIVALFCDESEFDRKLAFFLEEGYVSFLLERKFLNHQFESKGNFFYVFCLRDAYVALNDFLFSYVLHSFNKRIAVTGTNGKSSTILFAHQMLTEGKKNSGLIYGEGVFANTRKCFNTMQTTDDIFYLSTYAKKLKELKISNLLMEVSSHSLIQKRFSDLLFDCVIFTNLSEDHLDYHRSMEEYFLAKKKLFFSHLKDNGVAIINCSDEYGEKLYSLLEKKGNVQVVSFAVGKRADYTIEGIERISDDETKFSLKLPDGKEVNFLIPISCDFNILNFVSSSLALLLTSLLNWDEVCRVSRKISLPIGRNSIFNYKESRIVVDYAHSPDAFENIMKNYDEISKKIVVVFGCGGERNKSKREVMGKIAEKYADFIILTDDNPRGESPNKILSDIKKGLSSSFKNYAVINDRGQAILYGISKLEGVNSCLLVLGKGGENSLIYSNEEKKFSDIKFIESFLLNSNF